MIHILPNTKNSRLINFQRLSTTKNGIIKNTSLISNRSMVKKSRLSTDALNVILMTTAHVLAAMLLNPISTKIMVLKSKSCAKSAPLPSLRKKIVFQSPLSEMSTLQILTGSQKRPQTLRCPQMRKSKMPLLHSQP